MEESDLISLFSEPTWSQLDARLRDAVARDPANGPLVEVIRSPLVTLLQLWKDALPTLQGDPLAAERLRVTLQAASAAASLVPIALAVLAQDKNGEVHQPAMLRLRLLAVLVLAAARAQREPLLSRFAIRVIAGLALQCGPAEPLARLEPFGAPPQAYDNLLRLSVPPSVAAGHASHVYRLSQESDPIERGRWKCILEVIEVIENIADLAAGAPAAGPAQPVVAPSPIASEPQDPSSSNGSSWSLAHADGIVAVERTAGGVIEIRGTFDWWAPSTPFPEDRVVVVGFMLDHRTEPGRIKEGSTPQRLLVEFGGAGEDARPAEDVLWVGFVAKDRAEQANALRAGVRALLERVKDLSCTAAEKSFDSAEVLPDYDVAAWPILEPPPRTATNQLPQAATGTAQPPDGTVGGKDGARVLVVVLPIATLGDDELAPPSPEELRKHLQAVGRRLGLEFEVVTLPWVEDAGAVISSVPTGEDDPRVGGLLEVLSRAAARTPGRENALWVAVLPGTADVGVASTADAARGIGVATRQGLARCIAEMLDEREREAPSPATSDAGRRDVVSYRPKSVLARSQDRRVRAKASRLRVIGRLAGTALEVLEPPREEERGAGRGAPEETGVIAVALDRAGAELARTPIRAQRTTLPATFAALIPISPEVDLVELRRGPLVLARIERGLDAPTAAEVVRLEASAEGRVTATWTIPRSARPVSLTLEISDRGDGDDWVPFTTLHTCAEQELLPLWRTARARRIRLVACDGWAAIAGAPANLPSGVTFGPVVIRRVNDRTLWADVPAGAARVKWFTLVRHSEPAERRLDLTTKQDGEVRLSMIGDDRRSDSIQLGARDVYRRA
jgi:hypothetical protein